MFVSLIAIIVLVLVPDFLYVIGSQIEYVCCGQMPGPDLNLVSGARLVSFMVSMAVNDHLW